MPDRLETARLVLRPWSEDDAADVRALWAERDHRSARRIGADGRPTVSDLRSSLRSDLAESRRTGFRLYALVRKGEGDFIGYCGLVVGRATPAEPELAFELARRVHGHGYASEAAGAVVDSARAAGWHRLWSTVRDWNAPSFRVLAKVGFARTDRVERDSDLGDLVWLVRELGEPGQAQPRGRAPAGTRPRPGD